MHHYGSNNGNGQSGRTETAPSKTSTATVFLLDDDASVLKSTGRLLASEDWQIESFTDPHAFLSYSESHKPRVAVIDIRMPVMDGLEVQSRLRSISPETRVIVLTSMDDDAIRSAARRSGAAAF